METSAVMTPSLQVADQAAVSTTQPLSPLNPKVEIQQTLTEPVTIQQTISQPVFVSETIQTSVTTQISYQQQMTNQEVKSCKSVLQSLIRNQSAWPFRFPVDPMTSGAPDYFNVIKRPMDLSTVESKLKTHQYATPRDFLQDIILMFSNCFIYNPPTHSVHQAGKALEAFFGTQLNKAFPMYLLTESEYGGAKVLSDDPEGGVKRAKRTIKAPKIFEPQESVKKPRGPSRRTSAIQPMTAYELLNGVSNVLKKRKSSAFNDSSDDEALNSLSNGVQLIQQQLALLQQGHIASSPPPPMKKAAPLPAAPPAKKSPKQPKKVFDQGLKQELTSMISMFSEDTKFMNKIMQIITTGMPHLKVLKEELELDLNVVPPKVLWKLYNFAQKTMQAAGLTLETQPILSDDSVSDSD